MTRDDVDALERAPYAHTCGVKYASTRQSDAALFSTRDLPCGDMLAPPLACRAVCRGECVSGWRWTELLLINMNMNFLVLSKYF